MNLDAPSKDNRFLVHRVKGIPFSEIMIPYPSIRSLLDSQLRRYGDRRFISLTDEDGSTAELSYSQFCARVCQTANFLESEGGEFGRHILIPLADNLDILTQLFSAWMIGAVAVLPATSDAPYVSVAQELPDADMLFPEPGNLTDAIAGHSEEFQIGVKSKLSDDSLIYPITDTSGAVRSVVFSHYNLLVNAMAVTNSLNIPDSQAVACCLPLHDISALAGCIMTALYAGSPLILGTHGESENLLRAMREEEAVCLFADVRRSESILDECHNPDYLITRHTGLNSKIVKQHYEKTGIPVITGLSLPEITGFGTLLPLSQSPSDYSGLFSEEDGLPLGLPLQPVEITAMDEDGNELPQGKTGWLAIRGHSVMKGYLNDEAGTDEAFRFGWLKTEERGFYELLPDDKRFFILIT